MMRSEFSRVLVLFVHFLMASGSVLYARVVWDWNQIDVRSTQFPSNFLWGVATSEYQYSGAYNCPFSQWAYAEVGGSYGFKDFSASACDSCHRRQDDTACAQELGANAFRFSVEWSLVEPMPGIFNEQVLKEYALFCDRLKEAGMVPVVTLHHFTHPEWFERLGGFEKKKNLKLFVRFCSKVYEVLGDKVSLWCTINEPNVYAFQSYIRGVWPPGVVSIQRAGTVLRNLFMAHRLVYEELKKKSEGKATVGIVHALVTFEAMHSWNKVGKLLASYLTYIFHGAAFEFLRTGTFYWRVPGVAQVKATDELLPSSYDFIGLNYYSHVPLNALSMPSCYPDQVMTDMPYPIYPEGLYQALKKVSRLNVPIYITENGIADARDDRRALFIERYLYAVSRAIAEGCDVRGYFYWSLVDNFEWDMGYEKQFGLYAIDRDTQKRTLKEGARCYRDIISKHRRL